MKAIVVPIKRGKTTSLTRRDVKSDHMKTWHEASLCVLSSWCATVASTITTPSGGAAAAPRWLSVWASDVCWCSYYCVANAYINLPPTYFFICFFRGLKLCVSGGQPSHQSPPPRHTEHVWYSTISSFRLIMRRTLLLPWRHRRHYYMVYVYSSSIRLARFISTHVGRTRALILFWEKVSFLPRKQPRYNRTLYYV